MSKSWFGFSPVKFFAYKVTYRRREMEAETALFFKSFVPNYYAIAAELNKMTHKEGHQLEARKLDQ